MDLDRRSSSAISGAESDILRQHVARGYERYILKQRDGPQGKEAHVPKPEPEDEALKDSQEPPVRPTTNPKSSAAGSAMGLWLG
jgi:hypothetical protein